VIAGALHSSAELGKLATEGTVTAYRVDLAAPGGPAGLGGPAGDGIGILVKAFGPAAASATLAVSGGRLPAGHRGPVYS
jgi:hypothetical protein